MSRVWMRLDNAALIFPAVKNKRWVNVFRVSATLTEAVDPSILQQAVDQLMPRFPSMYVRLRKGVFWYYLEQSARPPQVHQDFAYPLPHMGSKELRTCCLRVLYFKNRIGVEFFHSLTDGTGGMIYLKTLTARYLSLRYGIAVPAVDGVLDYREPPSPAELEDSFLRHASRYALSRTEQNSLRLHGTYTPDNLFLITGVVPTGKLLETAHRYHATVTVFLAAVMAQVLLEKQNDERPLARQKPVKITVPVNLRRLYGSTTLRNFVLTLNPGVDPRMGAYTLQQLCDVIAGYLAAEATPQQMAGRIAANVNPQKLVPLKLAPLFVKNIAMRMVYHSVGERKGCLNVSNLGNQKLPDSMQPYVQRLEFIIGVQQTYPNNCSVASYRDTTCINMIRNIQETDLERRFFSRLVELDLPVELETNQPT